MIVNELAEIDELESVLLTDPERSVQGAYAGDLLSWVMGRAEADNAFVTIMTNVNVVAVAALAELSAGGGCGGRAKRYQSSQKQAANL